MIKFFVKLFSKKFAGADSVRKQNTIIFKTLFY